VKPRIVIAAGAVLVAGLVAGALLARSRPAATTTAPPTAASVVPHPGFPSPPTGAVVFAREWGGSALALGIVPRRAGMLVQASVLGPQGKGVSGLGVSLNGRRAVPCGAGCYRSSIPGSPPEVELRVRSTSWRVPLPKPWPPRDATALVNRAGATWRALQSLSFRERLASDLEHSVTSTWRVQAPDRVAYEVTTGSGGVVVGSKRWDRPSKSAPWVESPQSPLTQPVPAWVGVADAHVLATGTLRGHPVWSISFFDPGTPAWFEVAIDRRTYRTLESRMVTTAHFMHDVYGGFNATPPISPP
jgi:hypothetical protein